MLKKLNGIIGKVKNIEKTTSDEKQKVENVSQEVQEIKKTLDIVNKCTEGIKTTLVKQPSIKDDNEFEKMVNTLKSVLSKKYIDSRNNVYNELKEYSAQDIKSLIGYIETELYVPDEYKNISPLIESIALYGMSFLATGAIIISSDIKQTPDWMGYMIYGVCFLIIAISNTYKWNKKKHLVSKEALLLIILKSIDK